MFIHANNACSERIIEGHSCQNCSIESAFFGFGANKSLVFSDYSAQYGGSFRFKHYYYPSLRHFAWKLFQPSTVVWPNRHFNLNFYTSLTPSLGPWFMCQPSNMSSCAEKKTKIQNILSPSNWEPQNKQQKEMFHMTAYLLQKTELWSA